MERVDLSGTPRPHYLTEAEVLDNGRRLTGTVLFPSSDPSIGDRVDHVNVAHHAFAAWNAAHVLSRHNAGARPLAKKVKIEAKRVTRADTPVQIEAILDVTDERGKTLAGNYRVIFSDAKGVLAELTTEFMAVKPAA